MSIIYQSKNEDQLVKMVDYTLLSPSATKDDIIKLCTKAKKLGVKSVCVLPKMVKLAKVQLEKSNVLVCTVISFPHGTDTTEQKLSETKKAIADGADECDMVLNYLKLKSAFENILNENGDEKDWNNILDELVFDDVEPLVNECHSHTNKNGDKIVLKVIVESSMLTVNETEEATNICLKGGVDFIKTSTGMKTPDGKSGIAELNKVRIMYDTIHEHDTNMKIKASGGIRTLGDMRSFEPYVNRFGMGFGSVDNIFLGEDSESDY